MGKVVTVNAIILNEDNNLLVVKKNNHFLLPGGKLEPNESDVDALSRELYEEIGLKLIKVKEFKIYDFDKALNEDAKLQMRIYLADVEGCPKSNNEISEILWLDGPKYKNSSNFPKRWWDIIFYDLKKANILIFNGQN